MFRRKTKEALYASVATEGFKKLSKAFYIDANKKITKKHLVEIGCKYIEFGLKNANTYDLMFGTAVGNFADYPELLESANSSYENFRSSFSRLANDSDEVIAFKCITLWSMVHGLVGILRKVQVIGDESLTNPEVGPMSTANVIAGNLEDHLDKVVSGLIKN